MIRSWRNEETEAVWNREAPRKFRAIRRKALARLLYLDAISQLRDLNLPGDRLEKLKGDREGQYSIRINEKYRICFEWIDGDAYNVEITDYR